MGITKTSKKKTTGKKESRNPKIGAQVPPFTLPSSQGGAISSKSLLGSRYVLYFYPKDMTSGCTTEAHEFTALSEKFAQAGIRIFGVSPDSIESHLKFIKKDAITFPLLSDVDAKVATAFGVWGEKTLYGKKYMGITRSTFVVNPEGNIEAIYDNVKPEGHAICVLEDGKK